MGRPSDESAARAAGSRLASALEARLARAGALARWEDVLEVAWAGARLRQHLRVRVAREAELDLAAALGPAIRGPYVGAEAQAGRVAFTAPGRRIVLGGHDVELVASGTSRERPPWDGGHQDGLLAALLEVLGPALAEVETERATDTPFEEAAPRVHAGAEALALLDALVFRTARLTVELTEYFTDVANPCVELVLRGVTRRGQSVAREVSVRAGRPRVLTLEPGRYHAVAEARGYSFPAFRGGRGDLAHRSIWSSPEVVFDLARATTLRAGVDAAARHLDAAEAAFFASASAAPPALRRNLSLSESVSGSEGDVP